VNQNSLKFLCESSPSRQVLLALCVLVLSMHSKLWAIDEVAGANLTLFLSPSAQTAAMGDAALAMPASVLGAGLNPVGMLDKSTTEFGVSHTAHYESTRLDAIAGVTSIDSNSRLGIVLMRYGADGIPWIKAGDTLPTDGQWRTLSIADYTMSVLFAHAFRYHIDVAGALHFLYRELDQTGYGFRGDAEVRFRPVSSWFLSSKIEGITSSAAHWQSGELEYSPAEAYIATGYHTALQYFYGSLSIGYQSPGMFQRSNNWLSIDQSYLDDTTAASTKALSLGGSRFYDAPLSWFREGAVGAEMKWDWGGSIRGGWQSLREWDSWTVGGGLELFGWLSIDYAFQRHPVLSGIHRVSIEIHPWAKNVKPEKPAQPASTVIKPQESPPTENDANQKTKQGSSAPVPTTPSSPEESSGKAWEE